VQSTIGGSLALLLALGLGWLVGKTLRRKQSHSLRRTIASVFRRGHATALLLTVGIVLWSIGVALPAPDPARELFALMRCPAEALDRAAASASQVAAMPRYRGRPAGDFPGLVISYYQDRAAFTSPDYQRYVNSFTVERCQGDLECLGWYAVTTADALSELNQVDEAVRRLTEVASHDGFDKHFRFNAFRLLAFLSSQAGDMERAREQWQTALHYGTSRAVLENLAVYHQEKSEFDTGDAYLRRALEALTQVRHDPVCGAISTLEEKVTFEVNRANFYRLWAVADRERFEELRQKAYASIDAAEGTDRYYLDLYWTGAHIAIAVGDPDTALRRLEEARAILKSGETTLERYRKFRYQEIGVPYTSWLELRVHFAFSRVLAPERVAVIRTEIPGLGAQPYEAVARLLDRLSSTGYRVADDLRDLQSMRNRSYLTPLLAR
jgi:tetratricopeptide (TPR) repeat protein